MPQAALLCPPASAEARRRHAEAVEAAEAADARDGKELKAAAKAAKAAKAAGNRSREKARVLRPAPRASATGPHTGVTRVSSEGESRGVARPLPRHLVCVERSL